MNQIKYHIGMGILTLTCLVNIYAYWSTDSVILFFNIFGFAICVTYWASVLNSEEDFEDDDY